LIIAANQPYFIPYIGYFQLIHLADIFLIGDNYNFIKQGWIQRNRILLNGEPHFFGLEIKNTSSNKYINETEVLDFNVNQKLNAILYAYKNAPFFNDGYSIIETILMNPERNLSEFLVFSIKQICQYLSITTKIMKISEFEGNDQFKREYRIFDFCKRLGGNTYINPIGGQSLYHFDTFRNQNITLKFIQSQCLPYKQFNNNFVPNLSILDVIMFNSKETIKTKLCEYSLVKEKINSQLP